MRHRCIPFESDMLRKFPRRRRYLIGVSGGRDSVALLHWLVDLGYHKLIVCHLDHQLRGRSSRADARFVENLAGKYDVGLDLALANVRALAERKNMSIETAAREARYKVFAKIAKKRRCRTIFLAHHADDLVETFLINLFRGSGSAGLAGMREVSTLDSYVRERRLKFREDASNKNLALLRNRIRRRIIPYLEKSLGRSIRQNIWRTAVIAAEEENWIESQLPNAMGVDLSVKELRKLPLAFQRRQILKWLRAQNVFEIGFEVIERVRSLLDPATRIAKVNLAQDRHLRRRAGKIFVE